ncbi:unnamed protein product [Calypogeia fissa]
MGASFFKLPPRLVPLAEENSNSAVSLTLGPTERRHGSMTKPSRSVFEAVASWLLITEHKLVAYGDLYELQDFHTS